MKDVIFDLDGTLIDSVPGIQHSVKTAMESCGIARTCPDLSTLIGPPIRSILARVTGTDDSAILNELEAAFRRSYDSGGWRLTRCHAGVPAMLEQLASKGCALSIVTNKPSHATRRIVSELALAQFFNNVVCRDSRMPPSRSKAEMVADLMHRRKSSAESTLMVGDTLEDCHAAAQAGIPCAVVSHGYGSDIYGTLPGGCLRISSWDQLVDWCCSSSE